MTEQPPQPTGEPWGYAPAAEQPAGQPEKKAPRAWFKKKRFIIPGGLVALSIAVSAMTGGDDPAEPSTAAPTQVVEATADADPSAEAKDAAAEEAERLEAEQAAAEEAERAAAEAAAAEAAAAGTVAQQNAKRSAQGYLDFTAFSHSGLIDQLEFEGFSTQDATWAVDRIEVDWNEQAAKSAENYLEFTSFSRSGLIDQLVFEGFTKEQAEYGVSQTGL